jgi:hypothetical protein
VRHIIVTPALSTYQHPSLKMDFYKFFCKKNKQWADEMGRAVAEGPSYLIRDNYYGPVELWPLVFEGGESDSLSG